MILRNLTQSPVTTTGTITLGADKYLGAYKLNADGTNLATLVIKDGSSSGSVLVDTDTVIGEHVIIPMKTSGTIYYSVSGTNADVMLYEAVKEII